MPKRGNWGDWVVIDLPKLVVKRASCFTCIHYIEEDGSCAKTSIIPRIDGKECWKRCKLFQLSPEFMHYSIKQQIINVKGREFFEEPQKHDLELLVYEKSDVIAVPENVVVQNEKVSEDTRQKIICDRKKTYKIQFNVKSARRFRNILAQYYAARQFDASEIEAQFVDFGCTDDIVKEGVRRCIDISDKRIKNALDIVPKELVDAFVSVVPSEFPIELAVFFYNNGLERANNLNCQPYCDAMRAFALDCLLGTQRNIGSISVDTDTKKKLILLDALTTLFVDANIISGTFYQLSVEYIVKRINNDKVYFNKV